MLLFCVVATAHGVSVVTCVVHDNAVDYMIAVIGHCVGVIVGSISDADATCYAVVTVGVYDVIRTRGSVAVVGVVYGDGLCYLRCCCFRLLLCRL